MRTFIRTTIQSSILNFPYLDIEVKNKEKSAPSSGLALFFSF